MVPTMMENQKKIRLPKSKEREYRINAVYTIATGEHYEIDWSIMLY